MHIKDEQSTEVSQRVVGFRLGEFVVLSIKAEHRDGTLLLVVSSESIILHRQSRSSKSTGQCLPRTSTFAEVRRVPLRELRGVEITVGKQRLVGTIDLGDVGEEVEHTAGVAPLVVVPADELDEVLVERDTGLGVEDGAALVAVQVAADDLVLGVAEDA